MKKIKVTLFALAALGIVGLMYYFFTRDFTIFENSIHGEVNVVEGVAQIEGFEREFVIEKTGKFELYADWKTEPEGMITGVKLINEKGLVEQAFTAAWISMRSNPIYLEEGKYLLQVTYLTGEEEIENFYNSSTHANEEWNVPFEWDLEYEFKENQYFVTDYNFVVKRAVPITQIAVILGMLLGFCFVAIILTFAIKGDENQARFDERQEVVRGRGFKYAFVGFFAWNMVMFFVDMMQLDLPITLSVSSMTGACLGATIYAVYCIWNDGYFALNQNRLVILITIAIGGAINLGFACYGIVKGYFLINNQVTIYAVSLVCGIMCVVIWVTLFVKGIKDRKEA